MRRQIISWLLMGVMILQLFGGALPAYADAWTLSGSAGWTQAFAANDQNDYLQDQQTGSGSVSQDIVGDATYPSIYTHFTASEIAIRIRLSNKDGTSPYQFKNFAFIGVDADVNGSIDFFLGVYNPTGNNGRLGIYRSVSGYANIGPSTTGISGKPLLGYKPVSETNYAITQAADGSSFNGDPDYFISFKFPVADINTALTGTGITFSQSTPFRFITGTASQDNSFNQDINGMDKGGWSSGSTWNSLNVFSDVVSADGSASYYAVSFDKNTGDTEASPALKLIQSGGQALGTLPSSPTKRGMYFQEWNTQPDGSGTKVTAATLVNQSTRVYAVWSDKPVYTVTFNPNGGTLNGSTSAVTVPTINGTVGDNMPTDPTNGSNYFMGWNTVSAPTGGNPGTWFNSSTSVTVNTTVYAQWKNQQTNVAVFYDNIGAAGGTVVARIYSNGQSSNFNGSLPTVTRPGYVFGGWYNNIAGTGSPLASITAAGNYYAKWTAASYTVTFAGNGGADPVLNVPANRTVTDGYFGALPTAPTRAGYAFVEWNKSAAGTGEAMYATSEVSANLTVYAIWMPSKTVTFYGNGGMMTDTDGSEVPSVSILAVNNSLQLYPQPPARDSYTFLGWADASDSDVLVDIRDVTAYSALYAVWSPVNTVTFDGNGGSWTGEPDYTETPVLTAYGSVLYIPDAPARAGYTFGSWNSASDGSGAAFTLATAVNGDQTVYAQWSVIPGTAFTVQFETDGGTPVDTVETAQINSAPVSSKDGYTLAGWYTDPDLDAAHKVTFPYTVTGDTTLYAKWTAKTYTVYLNSNGGSGGSTSVTATYQEPMPEATAPTRAGYTFRGYFDQVSGGTQYYDDGMSSISDWDRAESGTLYAQWDEAAFDVTFDANGGSFPGDAGTAVVSQTYGHKYQFPDDDPLWDGYVLASWNTDADGGGTTITDNTDVTLTEDQTLYAIWTEAGNITLRYSPNNLAYGSVSPGSESLNPATETPGGSEATANVGYHFVAWQDEAEDTVSTDALFVPEPTEGGYVSADYTAVFAPDTDTAYQVEHFVMDTEGHYPEAADAVDSLSGTTGELLDLNDLSSNDLVVPDGITYDHAEVDGDPVGSVAIAADGGLVVRLYYARSQHELTLVNDTGTSGADGGGTYYYGQTVTIETTLDSGYEWDRWRSSDSGLLPDQSTLAATFTMPAGSLTLTARTLNLHDIEGTVKDKDSAVVSGAEVKIVRGQTQFGATVTTDADGKFIITGLRAGIYNLVMTKGGETEVVTVTVRDDVPVTELGVVLFRLGNASSLLKVNGPSTPAVVVGNLHQEAEDYFTDLGSLGFAKVEMTVEKTDEASADASGKTAIQQIDARAASGRVNIGIYLDMNIEKYKRNLASDAWTSDGKIGRTNGLIEVLIPLPEALQGKSSYTVYRYHGADVNVISTAANGDGEYLELDRDTWMLKLYLRNFSIYAIGYQVSAAGGSGGSSRYTVTFDTDGAAGDVKSQTVSSGRLLTVPEIPEKAGYRFIGWFTPDGTLWDFQTDEVDSPLTLTARWASDTALLNKEEHMAYMVGYPEGTFRPERSMTRAEAAVMFSRLLADRSVTAGSPSGFTDVDGAAWYADAVGVMKGLNIITGYADGSYRPDSPITRAEFASIAARFDTLTATGSKSFTDVTADHWAAGAILAATEKGWVTGYTDGSFHPESLINRAEVVTLVNRMLDRHGDRQFIQQNVGRLPHYTDLSDAFWAYFDIMEAVIGHDYDTTSGSEAWNRVK